MSSKKSTLQSKYLQSLPDGGAQVFALTGELSAALSPWMDLHEPLLALTRDPKKLRQGARATQLCLTLVAAAPFVEVERLLPATCMGAWLFVLDDLADEQGLISSASWARLQQFPALLGGSPPGADVLAEPLLGPLAKALSDIQGQLARHDHFESLRPEWVWALREVLDGMETEERWSARYRDPSRPSLPGFEEYLDQGALQTIGVILTCGCVLGALKDASLGAHRPRLMEMCRQAAICVRLANDLRTYEKELTEGKLNALGPLQREFMAREGLGAPEALERARHTVRERLDVAVARCRALGVSFRGPRTETLQAERFITNLVDFACDFYTHHDYNQVLIRQDGHEIDAGKP